MKFPPGTGVAIYGGGGLRCDVEPVDEPDDESLTLVCMECMLVLSIVCNIPGRGDIEVGLVRGLVMRAALSSALRDVSGLVDPSDTLPDSSGSGSGGSDLLGRRYATLLV